MQTLTVFIGKIGTNCTPGRATKSLRVQFLLQRVKLIYKPILI